MENAPFSESFLFDHKGIELPVTVFFFYEKEEPQEDFYPGSPEEFEIVKITIDDFYYDKKGNFQGFNFHDILYEEFGESLDVTELCNWIDGLEASAIKAFYNLMEKKKKEMEDA